MTGSWFVGELSSKLAQYYAGPIGRFLMVRVKVSISVSLKADSMHYSVVVINNG